jgi:hypothetical protein
MFACFGTCAPIYKVVLSLICIIISSCFHTTAACSYQYVIMVRRTTFSHDLIPLVVIGMLSRHMVWDPVELGVPPKRLVLPRF